MADTTAGFVDTSILIARLIHAPEIRKQIEQRLSTFNVSITGMVVRLEFKRRLLKDARYLLELFLKYRSFAKVHRHVIDVLSPYQRRKQRISLQLLGVLLENESDADRTERAMLLLKGLLRDGLYEFEQSVGHVVQKSNCACAQQNIRLKAKRYDFGDEKCSKVKECGVIEFLQSRQSELQRILAHLEGVKEKLTDELTNAADFIRTFLREPDSIREFEPCSTVGDLLIAIESAGVPTFYTMNGKESQHLCRALKQTLIVRPSNPTKCDDIECDAEADSWPDF